MHGGHELTRKTATACLAGAPRHPQGRRRRCRVRRRTRCTCAAPRGYPQPGVGPMAPGGAWRMPQILKILWPHSGRALSQIFRAHSRGDVECSQRHTHADTELMVEPMFSFQDTGCPAL